MGGNKKRNYWLSFGSNKLTRGERAVMNGRRLKQDHADDLLHMALHAPAEITRQKEQKQEAEWLYLDLVERRLTRPDRDALAMLAETAAPLAGRTAANADVTDAARRIIAGLTPLLTETVQRHLAEPLAHAALLSPFAAYRAAAAEVLGEIAVAGGPSVTLGMTLAAVARDSDAAVRAAAQASLARIEQAAPPRAPVNIRSRQPKPA